MLDVRADRGVGGLLDLSLLLTGPGDAVPPARSSADNRRFITIVIDKSNIPLGRYVCQRRFQITYADDTDRAIAGVDDFPFRTVWYRDDPPTRLRHFCMRNGCRRFGFTHLPGKKTT